MNLGGRVIKTVVASGLAVFIAQQVGLERVSFAGIIAIIVVQRSLFSSVAQGYKRIGSVTLGILMGAVFAFTFGLTPLVVVLTTFLSIQICLKLHWEDNIVLMTIAALNAMLFCTENFFLDASNQLALALIGAVSGISLNMLFSPYHKKEVEELLFFADKELRELLFIVLQDMKGAVKYDREELNPRLSKLKGMIEKGSRLAKLLQEEQRYRFREDTPSESYRKAFLIFASQTDRIEGLFAQAAKIEIVVPQVEPIIKIGRILIKMQQRALKNKPVPYSFFEKTLEKIDDKFATGALPVTRDEFLTRAALIYIFSELKVYYKRIRRLPSF